MPFYLFLQKELTNNLISQYTESPKNPAYIASQGPLQNCSGDFWQMVWEQGVSEIIMLSLNDGIDVRFRYCFLC